MNIRGLETILTDQKEELAIKLRQRYCYRQEENLIDIDSPQAQVVLGVRRSGKSTLCIHALHRSGVKFAYVNFDDERLIDIKGSDLNEVLEVLYKIYGTFNYLFIDEIQNIEEWYLFVNRLLRREMRVVITGSNAKLLSGELATHLTGRYHSIHLYPFSFREYCEYKDVDVNGRSTSTVATLRKTFDEYLVKGGFPELMRIKYDRPYISELVDNILNRDIKQRFKMKYSATFDHLAQHLLNIVPHILNIKSLQQTFSISSVHTVNNYVSYLKQAYLLIGLHKYSVKSRVRLTGEKVYPVDVSLMNNRDDAFARQNLGWRLEVIVFIELLRRFKPAGYDIYYFNETAGECDFLVCQGAAVKTAIQVSYDLSNEKVRKREIAGLMLAANKTGVSELLLLTDTEYADIAVGDRMVKVRPVYDWALS